MALFGSEIKKLRNAKGWSVRELSSRIGKTAGYISQIEGRGEIPSPEVICLLAELFEFSLETLLQLAKSDQLSKAESDIKAKYDAALVLYRKERK